MRRATLSLAIGLLVLPALSGAAYAWGVEGHEIIAAIAAQRLNPQTRQIADQLLRAANLDDMISVAPWADQYRFNHPESEPWHFADIPITEQRFDAARDCHEDGHGHNVAQETCIVAMIPSFAEMAADKSRAPADRGYALAFLIHFMGDVTQPLHASNNHDRGGNRIHITFEENPVDNYGHPRNLHAAWDAYMIDRWYGRQDPALVAQQLDDGAPMPRISLGNLRPAAIAWAEEAHRYAVSTAYGDLPGGQVPDIDARYEAAAKPVVDHQLRVAGQRLAAVIEAVVR